MTEKYLKEKVEWDFLGYSYLKSKERIMEMEKFMPGQNQIDWNQTLLTAINECASIMRKNNYQGKHYFSSPLKFKPIFETLLYFTNGSLEERFHIDFVDTDSDAIEFDFNEPNTISLVIKNFK